MPSFFKITEMPWKTPRYSLGASPRAFSSPWSCNRIFTVSKLWVTVTAPHAATPPAMNDLYDCQPSKYSGLAVKIYPRVVDILVALDADPVLNADFRCNENGLIQ